MSDTESKYVTPKTTSQWVSEGGPGGHAQPDVASRLAKLLHGLFMDDRHMPFTDKHCGVCEVRATRLINDGVTFTSSDANEVERLRVALDEIREITRPFSMTMSGPQWFRGDTDIFRGGNREKVWRIADEALDDEDDIALSDTTE